MTFNFKEKNTIINITVFLFFVLLWFGFSYSTKAIFSGFHVTDDHMILTLQREIAQKGFWAAAHSYIASELVQRFKPLIPLIYLLKIKFWGFHYIIWSVYNLMLAVITSFVCFLTAKKLKFNIFESVVFCLITFLSYQSLVWCHLAYDEAPGMFLLVLTLYFMVSAVQNNEKRKLYDVLFVLFYTLNLFVKETFIVTIPAILFLRNYLDKEEHNINWIETLKKNKFINVYFFSVLGILLLLIKLFIGTQNGYAGVEGTSLNLYIDTFQQFIYFTPFLIPLSVVVFFFILLGKDRLLKFKSLAKTLAMPFVFALLVCIPQIVVYSKSGFFPRYMLPIMLGVSFFVINLLKFSRINFPSKFKKITVNFIVVLYILQAGLITYKYFYAYAVDGFSSNKIIEKVKKNTLVNASVVVVFDVTLDYEAGVAIEKYLQHNGRANVSFFPAVKTLKPLSQFQNNLVQTFVKNYKIVNNLQEKKPDSIIVFKNLENNFNNTYKDFLDNYRVDRNNYYYSLYIKKKSF
jgi:hypothetical protein